MSYSLHLRNYPKCNLEGPMQFRNISEVTYIMGCRKYGIRPSEYVRNSLQNAILNLKSKLDGDAQIMTLLYALQVMFHRLTQD